MGLNCTLPLCLLQYFVLKGNIFNLFTTDYTDQLIMLFSVKRDRRTLYDMLGPIRLSSNYRRADKWLFCVKISTFQHRPSEK